MSVLRRDPATGRWVVIVESAAAPNHRGEPCPFCPGNEHLTPAEVKSWGPPGREPNRPGWTVRVVPNARPMLRIETPLERHAEHMYDTASGTGCHEIVIETPEHKSSLAELPAQQVALVLTAWAERITDLKRDPRFRSIFVFKNQGLLSGAWMPGHAHSQIIGLPVTPKVLKELMDGSLAHYRLKERCVLCDMLREELDVGARVIRRTGRFVAFAPFASRYPYETWILPLEHGPDFEAASPEDLADLAGLLIGVLGRLEQVLPEPAYNVFLYSGPNRAAHRARWKTLAADFHWHLEVLPRLNQAAGFEVGSGFYANPVLPEAAAAELRKG